MDVNNLFGRGCNALYSINGIDKSHAMYVFDSPEEYLTLHYNLLRNDALWTHQGELFVFRKDPELFYGSTTVTKSIKVEAQSWLVHMFCRFNKELFDDAPKYFFVY